MGTQDGAETAANASASGSRMRHLALLVTVIGAALSAGLTLYTGRHNPSGTLMTLFVLWVLSPFVALVWAGAASIRWPALARAALYFGMLLIPIASVAVYARVAFGPPLVKTAFAFLVTPLVSWLLIAILVRAGVAASRRALRT